MVAKQPKKLKSELNWHALIGAAKDKIERNRLKIAQLEALIVDMKAKAKAGEPSPSDLIKTRINLNMLLQ